MKRVLVLVSIAVVGLAILVGADQYLRARTKDAQLEQLREAMVRITDRLETGLRQRIGMVENLAALLQLPSSRPGTAQFDEFAEILYTRSEIIRLLVLVDTHGTVLRVYPRFGNEALIGLDLTKRPAAPFIEAAIRERRTTVNDPTVTADGRLSIVARTPYYRNGMLAGLTEGVFDISDIMVDVDTLIDRRIAFELFDAPGRRFFGSNLVKPFPLRQFIVVGDNYWELVVGWRSKPVQQISPELWGVWIGGLALLASLLAVVYRVQTREQRLEAAVVERTKALRASEERYKLVEGAVNDGIWDINLLTREVYRSPRWKQILGYSDEELPGQRMTFFRLIHPEDREKVKTAIRRHLAENIRYRAEFRMRHKDGSYRWVLARGDVIRDTAGRPVRMVGSTTDITERTLAEQALREHEERLRLALEASGQAMWELDLRAMTARYSEAQARMLGYSAGELPGDDRASFEQRLHPADRESVWAAFGEHLTGNVPQYQSEFRLRTKSGAWKWIQSTGKIVERGADGQPLRMVGTHTDIDRRKRLVESLRANESLLRHLLANSPIVIYTAEPGGRHATTYVSPNVEELFGFRPEQFLGNPAFWADHIHPDDAPRVLAELPNLFTRGVHQHEYRFRMSDGEYRWVHDEMRLIRRADGTPREIIGSWADVTARKQAEETINLRNRELTRLYGFMHSLREDERRIIARELHDELAQMITAIRLDIKWLEARVTPAKPAVVAKLAAMEETVSETVDWIRRISEGLRPSTLDSLGLTATIENHLNKYSRRTDIACELVANSIDCPVDERISIAVFRIVQEALTNVARHANATRVAIELKCADNHLRLVVQDNGRGLAPPPVGAGLGLLGMRERVNLLGGEFSIAGTAGSGVRLEVTIPLRCETVSIA